MTLRLGLIAIPLLALLACSATQDDGPVLPEPDQDSCNVRQYGYLIGQDATALEKVLILGQIRLIRPDTAVTLDFRPERVNFYIAADNLITRIVCG